MKLVKFAKALALPGLVAFAMVASSFAVAKDSGWYAGFNIGQSRVDVDDQRIIAALAAGGFTTTSLADDDTDIGGKLFGAYKFNKYLSLEGGYFDMGKFSFVATTSPPGTLSGQTKMNGFNLDPVLTWPIGKKFSVLGRVGLNYAKAKTTYSTTGTVGRPPDRDKSAANYKLGVGVQYDFAERFGARAELEEYRIDDAVGNVGDVKLLSVGLVYRFFGGDTRAATRQPAAKPVLVIVPAPAKTQQYCSILDIEFEINLNEIQREEKEKLGVLATFLKKYPDTTAVIEGHTDDVGSDEDNMELSQRRADSVVNYLVETSGIARSRLQAVGYGETRPLVDNDTEEGKRLNRRIGAVIACAQDIAGLSVKPARITMALEMEFDLNKADVRPEYRDELAKVAGFLKANPAVTATVEGHTGNLQGSPDEGMELSQRRAESVVNYLADNFGISHSRLVAEGFGQTRRFAYNTTLEGQQENRRVNIILNYPR